MPSNPNLAQPLNLSHFNRCSRRNSVTNNLSKAKSHLNCNLPSVCPARPQREPLLRLQDAINLALNSIHTKHNRNQLMVHSMKRRLLRRLALLQCSRLLQCNRLLNTKAFHLNSTNLAQAAQWRQVKVSHKAIRPARITLPLLVNGTTALLEPSAVASATAIKDLVNAS